MPWSSPIIFSKSKVKTTEHIFWVWLTQEDEKECYWRDPSLKASTIHQLIGKLINIDKQWNTNKQTDLTLFKILKYLKKDDIISLRFYALAISFLINNPVASHNYTREENVSPAWLAD